jgi:hypothetical protein
LSRAGVDLADRPVAAQPLAGEGVAAQHREDGQHLGGEGLVEIDEVDVLKVQTSALQRLRHREGRPHQELIGRVDPHVGPSSGWSPAA